MRSFWKKQQQALPPAAARARVVERDFLKMLVAAIVVGTVFSVAAATIILIFAGASTANADAPESAAEHGRFSPGGRLPQHSDMAATNGAAANAGTDAAAHLDVEPHQPAPGNLFFADGCGGAILGATERDVQITIKGDHAEVQVMQTFVIEAADGNGTQTATFHAVLPKGALYSSFRVQSRQHDLAGEYANDAAADTDPPALARQLKAQGLVRVYESRQQQTPNTLSSDPLIDLEDGETLVVTYRYQVPLETSAGIQRLSVALADPRHAGGDSHLPVTTHTMTAVAVWVMWATATGDSQTLVLPKKLLEAPHGIQVERRHGRIEGAAWASANITSGDTFHLAWLQ